MLNIRIEQKGIEAALRELHKSKNLPNRIVTALARRRRIEMMTKERVLLEIEKFLSDKGGAY